MGGDGEKSRDALAGSSTVGLLHNKVDKMIRLMVETSENQKKMNKTLGELLKSGFHKPETPSTCKTLHCIALQCIVLSFLLVFNFFISQPHPLSLTRAAKEIRRETRIETERARGRGGGGTETGLGTGRSQ